LTGLLFTEKKRESFADGTEACAQRGRQAFSSDLEKRSIILHYGDFLFAAIDGQSRPIDDAQRIIFDFSQAMSHSEKHDEAVGRDFLRKFVAG